MPYSRDVKLVARDLFSQINFAFLLLQYMSDNFGHLNYEEIFNLAGFSANCHKTLFNKIAQPTDINNATLGTV